MGKNLRSFLPIRYPGYAILHIHLLNLCYNFYISYHYYSVLYSSKYTKNLRNNGRMRVKFDKWLVHILFLCYLTILLNLAEGAEYGGC